MKQSEIADMLGISIMLVSRTLKRATEEGIVTIHVKMPVELDLNLGKEMLKKFPSLRECLVLQVESNDDIRTKVGELAAQYVADILKPNDVMGISWGKTIYEFARALPLLKMPGANIIQLSGGFLNLSNYLIMPSNLVKLVSERLGCASFFINAPMFVSSTDVKQQLLQDPNNQYINKLAKQSQINIIGLSQLSARSTVSKVGIVSNSDIEELHALGAIGDIAGFFIDRNGDEIEWSKKNLYIGTDLETISHAHHVIGLAGEAEKAEVCYLGIQKGYFNILITTVDMANELIKA